MTSYVNPVNAEFIVPTESTTKRLKFKTTGGKRKIVISSNWLPLYNFNAGDDMITKSLGKGKGMVIELVTDLFSLDKKPKKVYKRTYPKRKNNPIEALIEISSQKEINECFDENITDFHIKFEFNKLTVTAVSDFKSNVMKNALKADPYSIFAACTSGVDLHLMEKEHGFNVHSVIEYRPQEKKNKCDLTETGALTVLRNLKNGIKNLFNEDIAHVTREQLSKAVEVKPAMIFMASPTCDDFTNVKSNSLKEMHDEELSGSIDMMLDLHKVAESIYAPIIKFEQVLGWYKSDIYKALSLRLRKYGYKEHLLVSSGAKRGGLTNRTRGYAVFSMLDAPFEFEQDTPENTQSIWPIIEKHLPDCRDVTHSKSLQDGKRIGRLRVITPESIKSPTILKSQENMAKDSCVISVGDKLLWPSEGLLKELMSIQDFKTDCVGKVIGVEIIGQSVDGALHCSVARSIKNHIDAFLDLNQKKLLSA